MLYCSRAAGYTSNQCKKKTKVVVDAERREGLARGILLWGLKKFTGLELSIVREIENVLLGTGGLKIEDIATAVMALLT